MDLPSDAVTEIVRRHFKKIYNRIDHRLMNEPQNSSNEQVRFFIFIFSKKLKSFSLLFLSQGPPSVSSVHSHFLEY